MLRRLIACFAGHGVEIGEIERHYPFTALRLATPVHSRDALELSTDETSESGRVFTGGQGWEEPARRSRCAAPAENLSWRIYERLFVRWTDALGVYDAHMPEGNEAEYARATARSVQILETCVLVRRILRNIGTDIERTSPRVSVLRPILVWRTRSRLLNASPMSNAPTRSLRRSSRPRARSSSCRRSRASALIGCSRRRVSPTGLERRVAIVESQYLLLAGVIAFVITTVVAIAF